MKIGNVRQLMPVRRGDIRGAVKAYQKNGKIHQHETQEDARKAIVTRWKEIEASGVECGIEVYTNRERIALNALAREEWRDLGKLNGRDVALDTIDGKTNYAIGDRVVVRETIRSINMFNGSVGMVRGINGANLEIERRDGEIVSLDTIEYPNVQHAYCTTEWREQGSTRYAELQLVTEHVNQRSLTVGNDATYSRV